MEGKKKPAFELLPAEEETKEPVAGERLGGQWTVGTRDARASATRPMHRVHASSACIPSRYYARYDPLMDRSNRSAAGIKPRRELPISISFSFFFLFFFVIFLVSRVFFPPGGWTREGEAGDVVYCRRLRLDRLSFFSGRLECIRIIDCSKDLWVKMEEGRGWMVEETIVWKYDDWVIIFREETCLSSIRVLFFSVGEKFHLFFLDSRKKRRQIAS